MSRLAKLAPALAALTFALTASAGGLEIKGSPTVKFTAIGPGGLKIDGTGDDLKAKEEGGKLIFKASLKNLKTGIALRDKHTKKYMGIDQWPDASLVIDKDKVKFPTDKKVSGKATGKFKLHGVTNEKQEFTYTAEKTDGGYSVGGKLTINTDDYKIEQPCYLGVCVDKDIKIEVSFKLKE
jgi:polyisoprenoid-binding protein YceI